MEHTKGTWEIQCDKDNILAYEETHPGCINIRGDGWNIARIWTQIGESKDCHKMAEANAKLIAAAPDLLSACKKAVDDIVKQANILSTASEAEKDATINRLIDWLNNDCLEAIAKATI